MEERTFVDDIDRSIYDIRNEEKDAYRIETGLSPAIVEQISREKNDPLWMELFRLESLQIYNNMRIQDWGPSLEGLDMNNIATYVRSNTGMKGDWAEVPEETRTPLSGWESPRRRNVLWPEWAHSTIRNWYTTTCAGRWRSRAWYTRTWRAPSRASMGIW